MLLNGGGESEQFEQFLQRGLRFSRHNVFQVQGLAAQGRTIFIASAVYFLFFGDGVNTGPLAGVSGAILVILVCAMVSRFCTVQ